MAEKNRVKIPKEVRLFAENGTFKQYKKHIEKEDSYDMSKKEMKEEYLMFLLDGLPSVIEFILNYGHIKEVRETKEKIFCTLASKDFNSALLHELKNGNKIENIKVYPIILREIVEFANKKNEEAKKDNVGEVFDLTKIIDTSKYILKKKLTKLVKSDVDEDTAFDVLSVLPTKDTLLLGMKEERFSGLNSSQVYRMKCFFDTLYTHAKDKEINFDAIMKRVVDSNCYPIFILFALLERKEKISKLSKIQMDLYIKISSWCFEKLNSDDMTSKERFKTLEAYANSRKRDDFDKKDGNRRYSLITLSTAEYPEIVKSVNDVISQNPDLKKYFN